MLNFFIQFGHLGPIGLWVVGALIITTLLYVVYRLFGIIGMLVFLILFFFSYVVYSHDLFSRYKKGQELNTSRIRALERELNRD